MDIETAVTRATDAIDGRASPLNPKVGIEIRSDDSSIFEVAKRSNAVVICSDGMPVPLSITMIDLTPPPTTWTSTRVEPASSEFSTSSLTPEAGRSITSPAAMRDARSSLRTLICINVSPQFINQHKTEKLTGATQNLSKVTTRTTTVGFDLSALRIRA